MQMSDFDVDYFDGKGNNKDLIHTFLNEVSQYKLLNKRIS